jgi:hypothetical protein
VRTHLDQELKKSGALALKGDYESSKPMVHKK